MRKKLEELRTQAASQIKDASEEELKHLQIKLLGRKGELTSILRGLADLSEEERPEMGQLSNEIKQEISAHIAKRMRELKSSEFASICDKEWIDTTIEHHTDALGHIHPISKTKQDLEDFFLRIGFDVKEGPHMEEDYYNFEALNIPPDHPARDLQDTFWLTNGKLLRTHTSGVQARVYENQKPPIRVVCAGRTYRYESVDACHENTFNQIEGFMIDKGVTLRHMLGVMREMMSHILGEEATIRFRPAYYPFVEPGGELDVQCTLCGGSGCATCKYVGWSTMLGCGMVHPKVLEFGGIDPNEYSGFAFGMGIDRLTLMRHKITDIRALNRGDLREMRQFTDL